MGTHTQMPPKKPALDGYALSTSVGLLDALLDAAAAADPGRNAARYAADLKRLGEGAARAAEDVARAKPARKRSAA